MGTTLAAIALRKLEGRFTASIGFPRDLYEFNRNILGVIEVIAEFK